MDKVIFVWSLVNLLCWLCLSQLIRLYLDGVGKFNLIMAKVVLESNLPLEPKQKKLLSQIIWLDRIQPKLERVTQLSLLMAVIIAFIS